MNPTAQTSVAETAATPKSSLSTEAGLGLVTTLHCVPFQCSISVWEGPPLACHPTAQASLAETAATLLRPLLPFGLGLGTTLHFPHKLELNRFWKPFQLDVAAFAPIVLSDRALSRTVTTHSSIATLIIRFIMCSPDFIFYS